MLYKIVNSRVTVGIEIGSKKINHNRNKRRIHNIKKMKSQNKIMRMLKTMVTMMIMIVAVMGVGVMEQQKKVEILSMIYI